MERSLLNFFPILATRWRPGNLYIISSRYQVGLDLFHEFGSKYPKYQEEQRSTKENKKVSKSAQKLPTNTKEKQNIARGTTDPGY